MKCRKCEKEIKINSVKECFWCPDCRLRGPAVSKDAAVEADGGITVTMIKEIVRAEIESYMSPKVKLEGLTEEVAENLVKEEPVKTWKEQARELEIPTYDKENNRPRLKADVLTDIAKAITAEINVP